MLIIKAPLFQKVELLFFIYMFSSVKVEHQFFIIVILPTKVEFDTRFAGI